MSVFGDIVKESRYIDDKVYVSFDEENYRRLELKLKMQEQEIERLHSIIKEVREYIKENTKWYDELLGIVEMHGYNTDRIPIVFVDELLEILDKENK